MDPEKRAALEYAGFKFGTVQELLGLTDEESAEVDAMMAAVVLLEDDEFAAFLKKIDDEGRSPA